jgi:DNA-binding transcriptional LysR family regulator
MKPTLNQIEAFHWIARLGTFHAAGAQLNLTQPTISLRIRGLEAALGCKLFERIGQRVRLTGDGAQLLPTAERIVALSGQLASGGNGTGSLFGRLRLGAPDSFGLTCMAGLLSALKERHPELAVALTIDNSAVLVQKLNARELDFAFVVDAAVGAHIRVEPLGMMDIAWVGSPRLDLPKRAVRPVDLLRVPIFTNPEPSTLMAVIRAWFGAAGIEVPPLSTCNSLSVILRLTLAGEGVSLLPTAILSKELGTGRLRALGARPAIARSQLFAAYQIDKLGGGALTVIDIARKVIRRSRLLAGA